MSAVFDIEVLALPDEEVLAKAPAWSEEEALTRVPKSYKKSEAINGWIEDDRISYSANLLDRAALNAETCRVAVVGLLGEELVQLTLDQMPEERLIAVAFHNMRAGDYGGWNVHGYDIPILIKRAWILGVPVPRSVFNPTARYPIPERFVDLMKVFACGNRKAPFTSLNNAAKAIGIPGKTGSGKDFGKLWQEDREKALEYNRQDLLVTAEIARRLGVL